mgnify:CR=1 FL=1|jgi:hypothetical protein
MNKIKNFAFFWIGPNISIPTFLVNSIVKTYSSDVNIYFLTDKKTPYISGVTTTIRSNLSKDIMIARLQAYSKLKINEQVFFLDADSLVINQVDMLPSKEAFIIFRRKKEKKIINNMYPEWYPEFKNKTLDEMMPFLFGAIVTNSNHSYKVFLLLLEVAKKLPKRFHRWYGDQYSLKIATENNLIQYKENNFDEYINIIKNENDLINPSKNILTFKGPNSKIFIKTAYEKYV